VLKNDPEWKDGCAISFWKKCERLLGHKYPPNVRYEVRTDIRIVRSCSASREQMFGPTGEVVGRLTGTCVRFISSCEHMLCRSGRERTFVLLNRIRRALRSHQPQNIRSHFPLSINLLKNTKKRDPSRSP
jgi:hypothetical protein